jgi:hypothetical protein
LVAKQDFARATWGPGLASPFCPIFAGASSSELGCSPGRSVHRRQFLWFKGRCHLWFRKDFNGQRLETPRNSHAVAKLFFKLLKWKMRMTNFLVSRDPLHPAASGVEGARSREPCPIFASSLGGPSAHDNFCGSKAGATLCLAMISIGSGLKPRVSQRYRNILPCDA